MGFKNRGFAGAQLGAFAISASFFAVFLYTTLYLQNVRHMSAVEAGLVYMPGTVIAGSPSRVHNRAKRGAPVDSRPASASPVAASVRTTSASVSASSRSAITVGTPAIGVTRSAAIASGAHD